jgi:hypothetical protein
VGNISNIHGYALGGYEFSKYRRADGRLMGEKSRSSNNGAFG